MASNFRVFPCNTCSIAFTTSELQRSHMRQPWHVSNLKRRIARLPALSEEQYDTQTKSQVRIQDGDEQRKPRNTSYDAEVESDDFSEDISEAEDDTPKKVPLSQCLFCNLDSRNLNANIDHMSSTHGLFIPSRDKLSHLESFLEYLAIIIFEYNECLYCSLAKGSVEGVQTHMRDKGHCMLKMNDADSEFLDFWRPLSTGSGEDEDVRTKSSPAMKLSSSEMRLPSGAVITSRSPTTHLRMKPGLVQSRRKSSKHRVKRDVMLRGITGAGEEEEQDTPATTDSQTRSSCSTNDRRVATATRGEMGLVGISESQRRALLVIEKKMNAREVGARNACRYAMEQEPVKTKYYKTEAPIYQAG